MSTPPQGLRRQLGTFDAVVIGLGAMIGAGVFVAFAPAMNAAKGAGGPGLLIGLGLAGLVAFANATSSARLAALYPLSGGTYVYGRRRLGEFWGYLAGWGFVVGKTASCAAMALTVGSYVAPGYARWIGAGAVAVLTGLNYVGVQKAAWLTRLIVAFTLVVLAFVVIACLVAGPGPDRPGELRFAVAESPLPPVYGVLQAAGLLFFAFAGYARIATLGEEVRDPARTIPRAIPIALGITLGVYAAVAVALLVELGAPMLADSTAPLQEAVGRTSLAAFAPVVQVGAAVAALGSLLALILGVSRTTFAMARDRHLPGALDAIHPRFGVPHRAEVVVGAVVVVLVLTVDLRGAIGFSSFGVLVYYAIANASAWTLRADENPPPRFLPIIGLVGCLALALTLPLTAVLIGVGVLALGAVLWVVRRSAASG
ncbi:APC family permease [Actinopolymorpha alba]|uniref:APC family permease n=1 Tax=Actinopolymorpha alba TaxID=533267 RepID=UPI000377BFCF|nr:APC family permease [Actinopolymorpha alba]